MVKHLATACNSKRPRPRPGSLVIFSIRVGPLNWPADAGRPGFQVGHPRVDYSQAMPGRGHRGPAATAGHSRRPGSQFSTGRDGRTGGSRSSGGTGRGIGRGVPRGIRCGGSLRRPRPAEARRCSSDIRCFSGVLCGAAFRRAGLRSRAEPGSAIPRSAACADAAASRSACGGMKSAGCSRGMRLRRGLQFD